MIGRDFKFHDGKKGAALAIRIVIDAEEDMIRKVLKDGTVVVHLRSTQEDNHDNLLRFLSTELKIDKNRFDIIRSELKRSSRP